jgi:hypothetical protein
MKRTAKILLPLFFLALWGCERVRVKTYPTDPGLQRPPPSGIPPAGALTERPSSPETPPAVSYDAVLRNWKSHEDLVRWMEREFSFDAERFKKYEGTLPEPRSAEETFRLKSGIYIDAARFAKETLNRMNPAYQARIAVIIMRPYTANHYVCSFRKDGKFFVLDFGTPLKRVTGLHGPYQTLDEYGRFYEKSLPVKRRVEAVRPLP